LSKAITDLLPEVLLSTVAGDPAAAEELTRLEEELAGAALQHNLSLDVAAGYLAERIEALCTEVSDAKKALAALDCETLLLALAASMGNERAIISFEERFFSSLRPALRKMGLDEAALAEVVQLVRERLFVPAAEADRARIADLTGRGDLGGLVRVTGVRLALNLQRRDRRLVPDADDAIISNLVADDDPQAAALKARYQPEVRRAFEGAISRLSSKQRTILRLHLLHRLSIDEIGAIYRVHRATAARWLARLREELEKATLEALREAVGAQENDLVSLVRMVQSRLEVSFERLLQTRVEE
jgi:RNA polymerase sigma-70 factor (ECF subfamily)